MATLSEAATVPMTPVPQSQADFDSARQSYEFEQARKAHEEELSKGGAIKRQPYESTGTGAVIGGVVGAVAGGLAPIPGGTFMGGVTGIAAGEAVEQALYPGDIKLGESLTGFEEQVGLGLVTEGAGVAFRMLRPVKYVQPTALTVEQAQRKAVLDKFHIPYRPHEITDSGFHKLLSDIGESGILNPNAYAAQEADKNALRKIAANGLADQVGAHVPPDQLAQNVVKVIHDSREAAEESIDTLYTTIREDLKYDKHVRMVPTGKMIPNKSGLVGPGTEVPEMVKEEKITGGRWADISKTKAAFDDAKASYEDAAQHLNQPDMLKAPWYQTVSRASELPEFAQWNDAHVFLKETRAEIRRVQDAKAAGSDTATMADLGVLKKIEASLEGDLQTALKTSPDPKHMLALTVWDTAQKEVKTMSEEFRNETVLAFVKSTEKHGGEKAVKELVLSLTPEDVGKMLTATKSDPALQNSLKRSFLQTGIERAGGQAGDELAFDPKKARTFLFGKDEFTARKTDMLIPKQSQHDIGEFLNATQQQIDAKKGGKVGAIFMAMKGAGIVLGGFGAKALYEGDYTEAATEAGGAITFLMGPGWLASALQKPKIANLLIQGMRYSASQTKVGKVVQQIARLDEAFAHALQTAVNVSGVLPSPPVEKQAGALTSLPTAFPMEK